MSSCQADTTTCSVCLQAIPTSEFYKFELSRSKPKCKPCRRAYERGRYQVRPAESWRNKHLRRQFGMSQADYLDMAERQNHQCAICGEGNPMKVLAVDHDHETGRVRALLCGTCNSAIGLMRENPQTLRTAADYLEQHNVRTSP